MKIINLLPKNRQQELRYEAVMRSLWVVVILSLVSFAGVFLGQFGTRFYLESQDAQIKKQILELRDQVSQKDNSQVVAKLKAVNDEISDYQNLAKAAPQWSKVIKAFAPLPPANLKINNFSINPVNKSVVINGEAPSRDLVIQLYNNILQDSNDFYNIDYPLENVAQPTNISFHFTFYIKDALLKK